MHLSRANTSEISPTADRGPRLAGWKDIAAYLGKTDRTVKRWGRDRGLPVHRVPGTAKASVYAYSNELDRWLENADAETEDQAEQTGQPLPAPDLIPVPIPDQIPAPIDPLGAPIAVLPTARPRPLLRRKWLLAGFALLLAAVTLDVAVRLRAVPLARTLRNLLAAHAKAVEPLAVSEAERNAADDFYLRGRYEWNQRTPASLHRALDLFTQAIVHNPGDARAYAGLADTYDLLREYSTDADSDAFPRAIAAAKKAVALDDSLAEAHRALAFAEMYGVWDFAGAEAEFRRAIALDPKDPQARRWFANALCVGGRFPEALAQMDKAQELDPTSHATLADKGWMLYNANHVREGIELLKEVERSAPEFYSPHSYLMQIGLDLRDYPSFLSEGQLAAQSSDDAALLDTIASSRAGYERGGSRGLLQALYTKEKHYYAAGHLHAQLLARVCLLMGKRREALDVMEDAYMRKNIDVLAILSELDLLSLKDDPRYQALAQKINFPRAPSSGIRPPRSF
jgi:tetratricopeptide (TPR) repeat protein